MQTFIKHLSRPNQYIYGCSGATKGLISQTAATALRRRIILYDHHHVIITVRFHIATRS